MSKRSHGEGSVYLDAATGRWIAAVSYGYKNGRRHRVKRRARTKSEALRLRRELLRQLEDGLPSGRASMTITDLFEHFTTKVLPARELAPRTIENYEWAISSMLPHLGRTQITRLSPEQIEEFLAMRQGDGLARNSLSRLRSVLAAALHEAERRGWVARNVARLVHVPTAPIRERRALTEDQARSLLDVSRGHPLEAAVVVGLTRGLRPGEILGLKWSDIDLDTLPPTVTVRRTLRTNRQTLEFGPPKTKSSNRTLVLPTNAVASLQRCHARQSAHRLTAGADWHDLDLVISTRTGRPIHPRNFRRDFARLTERAGLGPWTPYELRHSAVSLLSAAGVPIEELADLAGHRDSRMTQTVYRHRLVDSVDAGAEKANEILGA